MYVRNRMNTNVVTVTPDTPVTTVFNLMMEHGYSQFPVVEGNELKGLITERVLKDVSPSKATSLSIFELNYLLSKTKVKDVMITDIITASPDMLIEDAAVLLRSNVVGSLPVVSEDNQLVGIITRTDIIDAFIEFLGTNDHGTRISLEVKNEIGTFAKIANIIKEHGINIHHVSNYDIDDNKCEMIIRLNTTDVEALVDSLKNEGYNIFSVVKKE
ncbi:MAG: CBS domain-containing protein [Epulopiscium sp.]|jgi:acetoin utilization protein AcuB|nr:CBS domain-containing protein [Candidatus Epulonipiscium sp.]HOQ16244.1 CBS and ACT domain-containing protein [Defluviitaleaceae bacterium]HPT75299.1 CBS and ACT domain-containing protein [Defluviitaleaceae bacterium]